ncbi:MAG: DNA-binding response regulator [Azospira oryzae]|jgi:DNA-binding LytR/AlgR family response regulator|nr:MAG: DNA-binding response regulator [Azospira oryzae]
MNVIVVEDEQLAADRLVELIHQYDSGITIYEPMDSVQDVVAYFRSGKSTDLIFLDIQLADGKSFEIFDQVKVDVPVVFTTAYDQYALQAFQLLSIDYLLKPIQFQDIQRALEKFKRYPKAASSLSELELAQLKDLIHSSGQRFKQRLLIKSGNKLHYKPTNEVAYFFADGKAAYLISQKDNRKSMVDHTLEELESLLDPRQFFRISRKFIVNVNAIAEIKGLISTRLEVKLGQPCEHDLSVSRDRVADFKKWLDR